MVGSPSSPHVISSAARWPRSSKRRASTKMRRFIRDRRPPRVLAIPPRKRVSITSRERTILSSHQCRTNWTSSKNPHITINTPDSLAFVYSPNSQLIKLPLPHSLSNSLFLTAYHTPSSIVKASFLSFFTIFLLM